MGTLGQVIRDSRKIVVKIGSNTLSDDQGIVNYVKMHNIVEQLCELINSGKNILIVSSGAGICGVAAINKWHRKGDMNYKQALCAIGQVELMNAYQRLFGEYNFHVGQMLLTQEDFSDHTRTLHIRNTLFTLVDEGVVPIINENDSVSVEEISIGDNDTLSALTANLWGADLLLVLSDIDGVFNKNPKEHPDAVLIEEISSVGESADRIDVHGTNEFGTGGMGTKLSAAKMVNEYGIPMILINGKKENIIRRVMDGQAAGTLFRAE